MIVPPAFGARAAVELCVAWRRKSGWRLFTGVAIYALALGVSAFAGQASEACDLPLDRAADREGAVIYRGAAARIMLEALGAEGDALVAFPLAGVMMIEPAPNACVVGGYLIRADQWRGLVGLTGGNPA